MEIKNKDIFEDLNAQLKYVLKEDSPSFYEYKEEELIEKEKIIDLILF